ncbi:DNA-processing protein DprA [Microbacterium pygmaeum]|uniref:DNA processing protein n=1 Tax=Microbacterium pygmaeum TaxID=370764 RepID=A0A1G7XGC7_9MICO|nr:DNA-processing protein DprA [Microbacterium pygmaeum]SDG83269.1 DNA processing protein [Microbacterium pygmaeum]
MSDSFSEDRLARISLAAASEPGDTVTGTLVARIGAIDTLALVASEASLPTSIDPAEGSLWRRRLAPRVDPGQVDRIREEMDRRALTMLTTEDLEWPAELQQLGSRAPLALWLSGRPSRLEGLTASRITLVGARAATSYGEHITMELAADLASQGRVIYSGGAYGIDGAAHNAATAARPGSTVAVLASGLDRYYPAGNQQLFERIQDAGGLLISELPPGAAPTRWRFLQRNRLLAVLSGATIVVEAGYRSGSLNVAGEAHSLGKPIGAVPGPVTSPASAGCHRLLQEGIATIVTDTRDAIDLLDSTNTAGPDRPFNVATVARRTHRLEPDISL